MFGFKKWYIWHRDLQTPTNGEAYFGPFWWWEIATRVNDAYADGLASFGELEEERLSPSELKGLYINPRRYWMKQLRAMR